MSVPVAYVLVVLTWSTTPLAIKWSAQGAGFALAVLARMLVGALLAGLLVAVLRRRLPLDATARRVYLVSGASLFGAMSLTYWAAGRLQSGLISVLFGLSPLLTSVLAAVWLGEPRPGGRGLSGMLLGLAGLALIFGDRATPGSAEAVGALAALLGAVVIHSANLVAIKRIGGQVPPLATTFGTLLVSLPPFALLWWLTGSPVPTRLPASAVGAILYLGLFGSVIGFALYFYVLKHLAASRVALVTLITPVLALLLGHALNGEALEPRAWLGSAMILLGLALHQWESRSAALSRG